MSQNELDNEKLYYAQRLAWDTESEEYESDGSVLIDGEELRFESYAEFLTFMDNLSEDDKRTLGLWEICHEYSNDRLMISDGIFDDVSLLSLAAARNER